MAMRGLIRHLDIATTAQAENSQNHVPAGERLSKNKGAPPHLRPGAKLAGARKWSRQLPWANIDPGNRPILMGTISDTTLMGTLFHNIVMGIISGSIVMGAMSDDNWINIISDNILMRTISDDILMSTISNNSLNFSLIFS